MGQARIAIAIAHPTQNESYYIIDQIRLFCIQHQKHLKVWYSKHWHWEYVSKSYDSAAFKNLFWLRLDSIDFERHKEKADKKERDTDIFPLTIHSPIQMESSRKCCALLSCNFNRISSHQRIVWEQICVFFLLPTKNLNVNMFRFVHFW